MKNYFAILQLSTDASADDIRHAYRNLAKQYHPDVNKAPDAHERFCEITEAYEFLMNHWPQQIEKNLSREDYEKRYNEYQNTDIYEKFRREAQERARRQAKMRYDKFKKQHEAFQESGINDIGLLFTIFIRILSVPLFLFLLLTPLVYSILVHWLWIFAIFLLWPFAVAIAWYFYDKRKDYFHPGKFYYSYDRIEHLFTDKHASSIPCYYNHLKKADSKPYKLELYKLKDIKIQSGGFRQHSVNYISESVSIMVPRSRKAFIIHSVNILIKILSLIGCILFLNLSGIIWRVIIGMLTGGILSRLNLLLFRTKSNVTYLYSYSLLIRVVIWLTAIILTSRFYFQPFDVITTDYIHFVIATIIILDSFIMQLISLLMGHYSSDPFIPQYSEITQKLKEGYIVYNDIPVISFIYPLFRWFFG